MQIYLVGGAVRDKLLGLESKDNDYVVVGSSAEEMLALGYKQVGSNFPVFLHPDTGDEYALARREKKTGPGYNGFSVEFGKDVSLEEDLSRRDLTINAMAMLPDGTIVDPYGGQADLEQGVLRHVSNAFAEDPLRVLRVARFVARYGFDVHLTTLELCVHLLKIGELDALTPERVWKEVSRMMEEDFYLDGINMLIRVQRDADRFNPLLQQFFGQQQLRVVANSVLDPVDRFYFYTSLPHRSNPPAFVPTDLLKDLRRRRDLVDIFNTRNVEVIKKFIDTNRAALEDQSYRTALQYFIKNYDGSFSQFLDRLFAAADAIYALDFTTLLVDVPKADIKNFVNATKMQTLKAFV